MMHQKALLFGDSRTAQFIIGTHDPETQRWLGRRVVGFCDDRWLEVARSIVKRGNFEKFSINRELREELLETKGTILVEDSPVDAIWGICLRRTDPGALNRVTWAGKNWLGFILTELREEFLVGEGEDPSIIIDWATSTKFRLQ